MFGFQPPQFTEEEIKAMEFEAGATIQRFLAVAGALYISPFVIDAVSSVF